MHGSDEAARKCLIRSLPCVVPPLSTWCATMQSVLDLHGGESTVRATKKLNRESIRGGELAALQQ